MSQALLPLALLTLSSSIQVSPARQFKILVERWTMYHDQCFHNISRHPPVTGVVCNRTFDKYACWPDGLPNTTVSVACPWYLPWYSDVRHGFVYRECGADGQWLPEKNASECEQDDQHGAERHGKILSMFRAMYTVGYSLSLGALVLALGILMAFRKLHCTRNNIHMNLFASFILRAMSILIKDAFIERPFFNIGQDINTDYEVGWLVNNETAVGCRIAVVMMQYSITANSYWLLVEGIYLHNLLVVTVLTEKNYFGVYLCIGWGIPLIFVFPWVIVKYLYENEECWEQNINMEYWWIIRSPILLSVLINFFIFIRIIKILVSKLRAHQMRYSDYKFRLAKSTLTLIPLLGIHPVLFSFVTDESTSDRALGLRLTKLFIDLLFSSFQGLLVAILYCFVNKEVQSEILKKWKRWKLGRNIEEEYRHTYSHTVQMRGGSLVTQPSMIPLHFPDVASTAATSIATTSSTAAAGGPEEKRTPVGCQNGTGRRAAGGAPSPLLPFGSPGCESPRQDDILLVDQAQCTEAPLGSSASNL
ncbi:glucagon receptor [Clupea harengus]|uniref:Glucagon receptor n=1 Tax=Clupea harengus TaxID=7950 RepID=A0A6P8GAL9_CLUHA|nr:glucagon receptor [Clupea harengus]XP_042564753.1 glucagon receptor [Clupea harengus]